MHTLVKARVILRIFINSGYSFSFVKDLLIEWIFLPIDHK